VGALNTAFGYLLFAAFLFSGMASGPALALATVIGIAFNFLTTGRLVFANRDYRRLPRYLGVYAIQFLLNWSALRALEQGMSPLFAQLILVGPIAVLTYLLMTKIVFDVPLPRQGPGL
jgi:putative flippase GtrA